MQLASFLMIPTWTLSAMHSRSSLNLQPTVLQAPMPAAWPAVLRSRHEGVAAGLMFVAYGDGAGIATAVGVIGAFVHHALRDDGHFDADSFHVLTPWMLSDKSPEWPAELRTSRKRTMAPSGGFCCDE
jgi:hypothetical protein